MSWRLAVVVLSLFTLLVGGCVDQVVLHPSTRTMVVPGASRQVVAGADGVVEVWVTRSAAIGGPAPAREREPGGFVLQLTGSGTRAEQAAGLGAEIWRDWPVEVWTVNYPGYGGSTGPARLHAILPAVLAVYDEMAKAAGDRPIFVLASSLGTAAALHVATERPVAGMVLRNPPAIRQMIMGQYGWMSLWVPAGIAALSVPSEMDSVANGERVHVPGVFVMADGDRVVPLEYQQTVLRAYAGEKRVIAQKGAGHSTPLSGKAAEELREGVRWLWEGRAQGTELQAQSDIRARAGRLYSEGTPRGTRARDAGQ